MKKHVSGNKALDSTKIKIGSSQSTDIRINIKKSNELAEEERKKQLVNKPESIEEKVLTGMTNAH